MQRSIALYFGIPMAHISGAPFSAVYAMLSMFVTPTDLSSALRLASYYDRRFDHADDAQTLAFLDTWKRTGYDTIVYDYGGALFGFYEGVENRIRQLDAVPSLREHGLDDHALVSAIRESQELSYIRDALASGVPRDYATA